MWQTATDHQPALLGALLALGGWLLLCQCARLVAPAWRARYLVAPIPLRLGAALAVLSGGAHLALIPGHGGLTGALFLGDGLALLAVAPIAFTRLPWRAPAAVLLASTVLAYLVYLLAGWEVPDQVGLASKLVEIAALGLLLVPTGHRARLPWVRWPAVVVAVPMLTLLTGLVSWGVALARPDATHQHLGATVQVANRAPTPEEKAYADWLLAQTSADIAPYRDTRLALAAGYRPQGNTGALHWINEALVKAGPALDPQHPQGLVYVQSHHGPVLVGAMFEGRRPGDFAPDPGGPLTPFHQHEHICISPAGFDLENPFAACPFGSVSVTVPPMLHVWIVPNPGGAFAIDLDQRVVKAIQRS
jgi:hypothetical protein